MGNIDLSHMIKSAAIQKSDNWNIQSNSCMLGACEAGMVLAAKGCKCHSAKKHN